MVMGYSLVVGGFFSPPMGIVSNSVIVVFGILIAMAGLCVGIDLKDIIHEFRLLYSGVPPKEEEEKNGNDNQETESNH